MKKMIDTIMFDLDGTLLKVSQEAFLGVYLKELQKVFSRLGMDAGSSVKAVWAGTKAMVVNDGSKPNSERFWEVFSDLMGLDGNKLELVEDACEEFYVNEFNIVKTVTEPDGTSKRLVRALASKGYGLVLATNPLFPACAITTRLEWIGLLPRDFIHITNYANSTFCKPNPGYFWEILKQIDKEPEHCVMVGNSTNEDMSAGALGIETFLVTDYLENESGADIAAFEHGSLAELEAYMMSLPDVAR